MDDATTTPSHGALSRRNAIKLGAAAGVGAAAWTGPRVGAFGATPAYAGACSTGEQQCTSRSGTTRECEDDYVRFDGLDDLSLQIAGQTVRVKVDRNPCTDDRESDRTLELDLPRDSGLTCRLRLVIGSVATLDTGAVTRNTDLVIPRYRNDRSSSGLPQVRNGTTWSVTVCCTTDADDCALVP